METDPESKMNPLYSILKKFNKDDLIIIKLDIDTPELELPLTKSKKIHIKESLAQDKSSSWRTLVSAFYSKMIHNSNFFDF